MAIRELTALRGTIPGMPTVAIDPVTKRFTKLSDEVIYYYRQVAAAALNEFTDDIAEMSLVEVPKEDLELAGSILYPGNDPASRATPEDLDAEISYNTIYAAAQHEGWMIYLRLHPVEPVTEGGVVVGYFEDETRIEPTEIFWKVEHYTTPGTKDHYLSDPLKAKMPDMEAFIYKRVREAFLG